MVELLWIIQVDVLTTVGQWNPEIKLKVTAFCVINYWWQTLINAFADVKGVNYLVLPVVPLCPSISWC